MRIRVSGSGAAHVGMFGRSLIMMNKEGDPKPGGGGDPGEGGDDGDSEKKFGEMFNKYFHKAMGEREKRLETKIMKGLETTLGSKLEELKTLFASEKGEKGGEGGDPGEGKKKDELSPETRAALQRAERDAMEAKEKAEKWEREAKSASEKARKNEERNLIASSLNGKVKPALLDMVVDQLHGKHVVRDEEDDTKILWKTADGELLPFKDGVETWAKSDFGKEVAPPVAARGSGGRGGEGGARGGEMNAETLGGLISGMIPGAR
jgi:hypothetical protein